MPKATINAMINPASPPSMNPAPMNKAVMAAIKMAVRAYPMGDPLRIRID